MLARSELAGGFFDTPLAPLWPLLQILEDFGPSFWIHFPHGLATFRITFQDPLFAQIFDRFVRAFRDPCSCEKTI